MLSPTEDQATVLGLTILPTLEGSGLAGLEYGKAPSFFDLSDDKKNWPGLHAISQAAGNASKEPSSMHAYVGT